MKEYNKRDLVSLGIVGLLIVIGVFTVALVSFGIVSGVDSVETVRTAAVQTDDFDYDEYIRDGKSYMPENLNAVEPAAGGEKQRHIQLFEDTYNLQNDTTTNE